MANILLTKVEKHDDDDDDDDGDDNNIYDIKR